MNVAKGVDSHSPVKWARWGWLSQSIARLWRQQQPSVLVLSLPRSGSSWVGETLGNATDALYLREPISQGDPRIREWGTVVTLDEPEVAQIYRELAGKAFLGWPDFDFRIVNFPHQWRLRWRRPRRVVVKEVNPLAVNWYVERFRPNLIHLIRHPAAVALSFQKHGWIADTPSAWAENGAFQAQVLANALPTVEKHGHLVRYEDICEQPLACFEELFRIANLRWDAWSRDYVNSRTQGKRTDDKWATTRNTKNMAHAWRSHVNPTHVATLRAAFAEVDLPFYQTDEEWRLDA